MLKSKGKIKRKQMQQRAKVTVHCEGLFLAKAQQVADANGGSRNNGEKGKEEKEGEEGNSVCS